MFLIVNYTVALHWLHASHLTDPRDVAVTKHSMHKARLTWNRRHGMTNFQEPQQEPTQSNLDYLFGQTASVGRVGCKMRAIWRCSTHQLDLMPIAYHKLEGVLPY